MSKTNPRNFDCPETGSPCLDGECLKTEGRCRQREMRQLAETREQFAKKQRVFAAKVIESLEVMRKNRN